MRIKPHIRWLTALMFLLCFCGAHTLVAQTAREEKVKVAFLYNFPKFIKWPEHVLGANDPIIYTFLGKHRFAKALQLLKGKSTNEHKIIIREIDDPADLKNTHVLFVSEKMDAKAKAILAKVKGKAVLTVGESEAFGRNGGHIRFYLHKKRLRFEINNTRAKADALKITSDLLTLAGKLK